MYTKCRVTIICIQSVECTIICINNNMYTKCRVYALTIICIQSVECTH